MAKELVYTVRLDAASASTQAAQLRAIFQEQLKTVDLSGAAQSAKTADAQAVASAKAAAQERIQAAKAETAERTQAARAAANAEIEEEKRATAAFKAELQQRTQAAQQQARQPQQPIGGGQTGGSALGGLGNAVLGGVAGYFTVQGARMIAQQAEAFAEFGTQVRRTEASFKILSGSAGEAEARINAIKAAGGGAVSELQAMELANQAVSLHLASTAQEFGNLTKAGREIALVSPVIHDVQGAISELGLAAANLSFRRLDQLGLSATEVKAKMAELQAANAGLDDSQAFLQASIATLDSKYGALLQTQAAQASGVEKLKIAFSDLYAEIASGVAGHAIDDFFGAIATGINRARVAAGSNDSGATGSVLDDLVNRVKPGAPLKKNDYSQTAYTQEDTNNILTLKAAYDELNSTQAVHTADLEKQRQAIDGYIQKANGKDKLDQADVVNIKNIAQAYRDAAQAQIEFNKRVDADPESRRSAAQAQVGQREKKSDEDIKPIRELATSLHDINVDNFFQKIHDGLIKSAELTADASNKVAEYRLQLEQIANSVHARKGAFTPDENAQVDAINRQIEALTKAAELNKKLQESSTPKAPGQDLDAIYARLNAIVAQTKGHFDEAANAARNLSSAIADSGSASADQLAQIEQLAAQANQADFSRIAESLKELNSGSLDAIPGIDALREKLTSFYDILASGQGLTAAQAAELAQLSVEADMLGGSTSALAAIQDQLGYSFLNSHEYVAALVQQVANLEALYGAGAIGADQFAGGMNALTGELYSQLQAAGALTPRLAQLLTMLNAVKAAASGGTFGPATPNGTFFGGFGGGGTVNTGSAGYLAGQAQAQAAAAAARAKADAGARAEAIKEQAKAAKQAAGATQSAFEDAAKGTQKAFEAVVDDMRSALQKVEGLFSPSKVTAEDMAAAKAGVYQPKADELLRQVKSAAENPADQARFASQIAQAREALQKIGVAPAENIKAMAAQLEQAWSTSALFSNKDNLKLINADAVKFQLNLAAKAKEGQENIYEYFGATLDGVKEKFAAKDPTIVDAVAAELQGSQDKNLKALGKSLQDGIDGAVQKALSNLAAAEAGFAKGGGGGGGGGGGAVSVGAIPTSSGGGTWIDKVSENVGKTYQNFADLYMPQPVTPPKGSVGGLYGPPAPTGANTTGLQANALTGTLKITAVELDSTVAGTGVTALVNKIAAQFDDPANRAVLAAKGPQMSSLIQAAFTELATYQPMAAPLVNELVAQFNDPANRAVLAAKGPEMSSIIQSAFTELATYQPMAGPLVNEIKAQFDDPANKAVEAGIGLDISDGIQHGIKDLAEYQDMTINLVQALSTQFLNEQNVTNYKAIGTTIRDQILQGVGSTSDIEKSINAGSLSKETEGADGKTKRKSAFDFGPTVDQVNQSLSRSFGASTDVMRGIGDSIGTFIGFGMTDHDFSTTSAMVIGSLSASFTGDQARSQLLGVGSAISGAIFSGFASSLAYQPWLSTLVQTVVSQAMESMTNSINDSLQVQAVGL